MKERKEEMKVGNKEGEGEGRKTRGREEGENIEREGKEGRR